MSNTSIANGRPSRKWSVEGFEYFWSQSRDPQVVEAVLWQDVSCVWPFASRPIVGRTAYINAITRFLEALPPFTVQVTDHAINGDTAFVRWVLCGQFATGPDIMVGVDRLVLDQGYVRQNYIHSDHRLFAKLAETAALG